MLPETDLSEGVYTPDRLKVIGVIQLRQSYPGLNGSGVTVVHPEGVYVNNNACPSGNDCWEVDPSFVGQTQDRFTWIAGNGMRAYEFPNTFGHASVHANLTAAGFYGNANAGTPEGPEGVAYGVGHVKQWLSHNDPYLFAIQALIRISKGR